MFNLSKYTAVAPEGSPDLMPSAVQDIVRDELDTSEELESGKQPEVTDKNEQEQYGGLSAEQEEAKKRAENLQWLNMRISPLIQDYERQGLDASNIQRQIQQLPEVKNLINLPNEEILQEAADADAGISGKTPSRLAIVQDSIDAMLGRLLQNQKRIRNQMPENPLQTAAGVSGFNMNRYKKAQQIQMPMAPISPQPMTEPQPIEDVSRFPVESEGDFINKFLDDLMSWNGQEGQDDRFSNDAVSEIQRAVGQGFEQEAKDVLQSVQQMGPNERENAVSLLTAIYNNWLSPNMKGSENITMSEKNPDGIIKFNLSDHIINNKKEGMTKTAADQFGQQYLLYGPTEKRICPKLRGKGGGQPGSGDVVSEYVCRHHCLDGLVIDDNKTVCGEALWRAHQMDKYSREYVNEDGDIVGGYLNKRFEQNRNVPEENKMRLKPGETRKPRPANLFGNLEARMQHMRNKEAEGSLPDKRDYRPVTDTSKPFEWDTDVDQNNVNVSQKERDRREEDSGHQTVQYTNKDKQENNPKLASEKGFNLKQHKTARDQLSKEIVMVQRQSDPDQLACEMKSEHHHDKKKKKKSDDTRTTEAEECSRFAKSKYPKSETEPYNPWAVCTDSTGREDEEKYERCVQHLKDQNKKENKKSFNLKDHKSSSKKKT